MTKRQINRIIRQLMQQFVRERANYLDYSARHTLETINKLREMREKV